MWADCERPQKAKPVCAWSLFTVTGAKGWIWAVRVLAISYWAASGPSGPFAPCSPLPRSAASRDQTVSGFSGWLARISCCLASQADFRLIRNRSEFNGVKTGVRIVPARTSCYRFRSKSDLFLFRALPRSFMQAMNGGVSGFGGSGLLAFSPCQRRSSDACCVKGAVFRSLLARCPWAQALTPAAAGAQAPAPAPRAAPD